MSRISFFDASSTSEQMHKPKVKYFKSNVKLSTIQVTVYKSCLKSTVTYSRHRSKLGLSLLGKILQAFPVFLVINLVLSSLIFIPNFWLLMFILSWFLKSNLMHLEAFTFQQIISNSLMNFSR